MCIRDSVGSEMCIRDSSMCDDQCIPPTKKQKEIFHKERNTNALIWLKANMITYEQWLKKF
jgi:hypothetical protein